MTLAAEQVAYQQMLEARRAAREHVAALDSIAEAPLVEEDAAKARAAVEIAWLEQAPTREAA